MRAEHEKQLSLCQDYTGSGSWGVGNELTIHFGRISGSTVTVEEVECSEFFLLLTAPEPHLFGFSFSQSDMHVGDMAAQNFGLCRSLFPTPLVLRKKLEVRKAVRGTALDSMSCGTSCRFASP